MKSKNITILRWITFFTYFRLYAAIAIIYFAKVTGSYALGATIFSVITISTAFFEIPTGIFSDRIGRKNTVVLGALAAVIATTFYALGQSFWLLAIGALFQGLSSSFYSGNNDALLYNTLAEKKQEEHYAEYRGRIGTMFQLGLAVSTLLGGLIATWSLHLIMWISIIPQLLCLSLAFFLIEPKVHTRKTGNIYSHLGEAWRQFIHNKKLRTLSIATILSEQFGEASYAFQAAFYQKLIPLWLIGIVKTISNIEGTISFHYSGRILKKFNGIKVLVIDNIYNSLANIIAVVFSSVLSPFIMTTTSIFYGVTSVAKSAYMQKEFTNEQRATMGSLISFAGSLFFGILSIVMGILADRFSPATAFLILMIFQLGILVFYWRLRQMD
jgi:MFS family permease